MSLVGLLIVLLLLGLLLWGATRILAVIPVAEPFRTIIYVVLVIAFVLIALQYLGLGAGFGSVGCGGRLRL